MSQDSEIVPQRITLHVALNAVSLVFHCGDNYEAQVLFDDLQSRLKAGKTTTLTISSVADDSQ